MLTTSETEPQEIVAYGRLHPKRLAKTTAAVAALTSALSIAVGLIAARAAPHGLRGIAVSLHLARPPMIVRVAAAIATLAVLAGAVSSLLHFYTWWKHDNGQ